MVSHAMEEVAEICDRLVVMHKGEIAMDGSPDEIFTHARELEEMGLSVPQVTKVFSLLRDRGLNLPDDVYTLEQAISALRMRKGDRIC